MLRHVLEPATAPHVAGQQHMLGSATSLATIPAGQLFAAALATRAAMIALLCCADALVADYDRGADLYAVANPQSGPPLARAVALDFAVVAPQPAPPRGLASLWHWDAVHFRHIAQHGYTHESNRAFFPLIPWALRELVRVIDGGAAGVLGHVAFTAVQAVLFGLATVALRSTVAALVKGGSGGALPPDELAEAACRLALPEGDEPVSAATRAVTERRVTAAATLLFLASPASVFFTVSYTETAYAVASLAGLRLLIFFTQRPVEGRMAAMPVVTAGVCFLVATMARSNGIVLAVFPLHAAVVVLWRMWLRPGPPPNDGRGLAIRGLAFLRVLLTCLLAGAAVAAAALAVAPYLGANFASFQSFCVTARRPRGETYIPFEGAETPPANASVLPGCPSDWRDMYAHIQRRYWGVGWFAYYTPNNIPNFAIAAPLFGLVGVAFIAAFRRAVGRQATWGRWLRRGAMVCFASPHTGFLCALLLLAATRMHVQVATRFVASCPALYVLLAGAALRTQARWYRVLLAGYVVTWVTLGTVLFSNFYPWT